jgi:hypothetical protein
MSGACEGRSCESEVHGDREERDGVDAEEGDREGPSGYEPL